MAYLVGVIFLSVVVALAAFASARGSRVRGCCSIADPQRDLRMRAAFTDEDLKAPPPL